MTVGALHFHVQSLTAQEASSTRRPLSGKRARQGKDQPITIGEYDRVIEPNEHIYSGAYTYGLEDWPHYSQQRIFVRQFPELPILLVDSRAFQVVPHGKCLDTPGPPSTSLRHTVCLPLVGDKFSLIIGQQVTTAVTLLHSKSLLQPFAFLPLYVQSFASPPNL